MAIIADIRVNKKFTVEELVNHVRGSIDQFGQPFDTVVLNYSSNIPGRPGKTHGFDDVFITINEGSTRPVITYRGPSNSMKENGSLEFNKNEFGILEAHVPRTKHNLKMLASMFYNNMFIIKDAKARAEIEDMAIEMLKNRTREQVEMDNKILDDSKRMPMDEAPFKENTEAKKQIDDEDKAFLKNKIAELEKKLNDKNAPKEEPVAKMDEGEKKKLAEEYNNMKNRALELGCVVPPRTPLGELRKILEKKERELVTSPEGTGNDNQRNAGVSKG